MLFDQLQFCYPWRAYQARVLGDLETHLEDDHLHVVAAPGSGKTVLGLEVMRRLGKRTLVFSPTQIIRDQWAQRLNELFTPAGAQPVAISKNLYEPADVTTVTYQALFAAWARGQVEPEDEALEEEDDAPRKSKEKGRGNSESLLKILVAHGIEVIILDEAHHLRKAWWEALIELKRGLPIVQIVALTATPPYDVQGLEWQRYEQLNGPIDTVIDVPELVQRGDLCPHQDYLYLSVPTPAESEHIESQRKAAFSIVEGLLRNKVFLRSLRDHPWIDQPTVNEENILLNVPFCSSMLIFLNAAAQHFDPKSVKIISGGQAVKLPRLDGEWTERLLDFWLFKTPDAFPGTDDLRKELLRDLRAIGVLEKRSLNFENPKAAHKMLASSLSKLTSITSILSAELLGLGEKLRLVVLSDYIRADQMPQSAAEVLPLSKLGVVPIFETLRRAKLQGARPGVLSGSLIIIPVAAEPVLRRIAEGRGLNPDQLRLNPLAHDAAYAEVKLSGASRDLRVSLLTELFTKGSLNVLVGTQALLGEGWDAPVINSLVLASTVGSFMLSNQMRGRAIRSLIGEPEKTSNIWHLAALDHIVRPDGWPRDREFPPPVNDLFHPTGYDYGADLNTLVRRFKSFPGPAFDQPLRIENGLSRLALPRQIWGPEVVQAINDESMVRAADRGALRALWQGSLINSPAGARMREVVEVFVRRSRIPRLTHRTIAGILAGLFGGLAMGVEVVLHALLESFRYIRSWETGKWVILTAAVGFAVWGFKHLRQRHPAGLIKAMTDAYHEMRTSRRMLKLAKVILRAMVLQNKLSQNNESYYVEVVVGEYSATLRLAGGNHEDQHAFMENLVSFVGAIDDPRYLLLEKRRFGNKAYALPPSLSGGSADAKEVALSFRQFIGACSVVYTRSVEGRRALLKARNSWSETSDTQGAARQSMWT